MRLAIECGHGMSYRSYKQVDVGLVFSAHRLCENTAMLAIGIMLRKAAAERWQDVVCSRIYQGTIEARLTELAEHRKPDLVISLHVGFDLDRGPGKTIKYMMPNTRRVAESLGERLGVRVEKVGLDYQNQVLRYNPSIEIEWGNVATWEDRKWMPSRAHHEAFIARLLDGLEELEATDVLPLRLRRSGNPSPSRGPR